MTPTYASNSPNPAKPTRTIRFIRVRLIRSPTRKSNRAKKEAALQGLGLKHGRADAKLGRSVVFDWKKVDFVHTAGMLREVHSLIELELLESENGLPVDVINDPGSVKVFLG